MDENKKEEDVKKVEEKKEQVKIEKQKKSKTPLIITIIVLIVVIAAVCGYFIWQNMKKNETVGTTWGDTYYAFLKAGLESEDENMKEEYYGLNNNMKDVSLQFIDVEEDSNPVMVIKYKEDDSDNYVNIYNIQGEQNVNKKIIKEPADVELLYNINLEKYIWYIHINKEDSDVYTPITLSQTVMTNEFQENSNLVEENVVKANNIDSEKNANNIESEDLVTTGELEEIIIEKGEETVQETVNGDKITISKFDETFIKPEVEESSEISIDLNNIEGLKESVEATVNGYKTEENVVTETVKTEVKQKVEEVESIKQDIKDAKEEIKKKEEAEEKRKAEEAKKKAEEEAKKAGVKAGNYTLKYGTYTPDVDGPAAGIYSINADGTFTYKNDWENAYGENYTDNGSGTYKVYFSEGDMYDDTQCWVISFKFTKYSSTYEPSNELPQSDKTFDITGNNKFQYRQSIGVWTLD